LPPGEPARQRLVHHHGAEDRDATGRLLRDPTGSTLVGSRSEHPVASRYRARAATVSNEGRPPIEGEVSMHIGKRHLLRAPPLMPVHNTNSAQEHRERMELR
jgi:hypothetical protein